MGGLAGVVHFRGESPDPTLVARMSEELAVRGPDGEGSWADERCAVAHRQRRVSSIARPQPEIADDLVVLLDGWIYEHEELADQLGVGRDRSDTEVLLLAWRRWGPDTLARLEGEFAFAVWDRQRATLTLARDRLGVRPLHYATRPDRVAFCSEIRPLLGLDWVSRDHDPDRLAEYLSFQVVHAPRTLLRDVHQVEPGGIVQAHLDGVRARTWWRLRYAPVGTAAPREGEVVEALQEAVDDAVRKRVPRAVQTGLYLSGGLGSAAIAVAARRHHLALPGYTVSFADDEFPEAPFAGRVARLLGLEHHQVVVGTAELADTFDDLVTALGQPVGHPGGLLQIPLARAARRDVRVVLSGDGGEELFGGRMLDGLDRVLRGSRLLARVPVRLRRFMGRDPAGSDLERLLGAGIGGADLFSAEERGRLLRDHGLVRPRVRQEVLEPFYRDLDTDPVNTALHGFLRSSLVANALTRADRTAAFSGLDVRMPLLDRRVVESAAALPGSLKRVRVGGSLHTRWPLRAMLEGVLPPSLVDRPKRGLPVPLGAWLAGPGRLFMEERVRRLRLDPFRLWRSDAIEALRRDATRSNAAGNRLWSLFILDAWLRTLR